jgi:hypothetical protein
MEKSNRNNKGQFIPGHPSGAIRWSGGKTRHAGGYIYISSPGHPNRDHHGYVFEHRLVVENWLKRYLTPDEHVHHINGVKDDNRLENLEIMSNSEHLKLEWTNAENNNFKNSKRAWFRKGQKAWNKGLPRTWETRKKI